MRILRAPALLLAPLALAVALLLAAAPRPASADVSVLGVKNALVQFLLRQIGTPGAFEVTAGAVTEPEPGVTALNDVRVADAAGVWLTVRQVSFSWTPSALLAGRVEIDRLRIDGLLMARLSGDPELEGGELAERPAEEGFAWPRSPIPLAVNRFELSDVFLSDKVLPQGIAFNAEGAVTDEGDAQRLQLNLARTDAIAGRIDLAYDRRFGAQTLALTLEAEEAAGGLVATAAGLPEGSASRVSLKAEGPPTAWRAQLSASSDRVFDLSGAATIAYQGPISADVDLRLGAGETLDPALRRAMSPEARLVGRIAEGRDGVIRIEEAFLRAADLDLKIDGRYGRRDGAMDFALQGEARRGLSELTGGAAFERISLDGELKGVVERFDLTGEAAVQSLTSGPVDLGAARLRLAVSRAADRFGVKLGGEATALRIDRLGPETLGETRLAFDGAMEGGRFDIKEARLENSLARLSISGGADLDGERLDLSYDGAATDLEPVFKAYGLDGAGAAALDGSLKGPFADLAAVGAARLTDLQVDARTLGSAELTHRISISEATTGALRLQAEGGDFGEADASLDLRADESGVALSDISVRVLGASLGGRAFIAAATGLAEARLTLDAGDLRPIGRALDLPLSGGLGGDLIAAPHQGGQSVRVDLSAERLSVDGRRFASGPFGASIANLDSGAGLNAGLRWALSRLDGGEIGSANLSAQGALDAFDFTAAAALKEEGDPVTFSAGGAYRAQADGATLRLAQARTAFGDGAKADAFALVSPLLVSLRGGAASFERLAVALPRGGALRASLAHAGEDGVSLDANMEGLSLEMLRQRFGAPVGGGAASAALTLDTRPGRAGGRLQARTDGLTVGRSGRTLDAAVEGDWDGARAALKIDAAPKGAGRPLAASLVLPLRPDAGGVLLPENEPIEGKLVWSGEIADYWPLVPAPDHLLSGRADLDLAFGGTLAAPKVSGRAALTGGRYENLELGTILENVAVKSRIEDGSRVRLDLGAKAGEGRVEGEVMLDLAAPNGARIKARSRLVRALIARRDDFKATASGGVDAEGPLDAPRISGRIAVDEAELRLIAPVSAEIPDLGPVRPFGSAAAQEDDRKTKEAVSRGPSLDLTIEAPRKLYTRGRGLDAEWRAALAVTGYAASPVVAGTVEKLRGRLDLLGRRFELSRGLVVFNGGTPIDPRLDVVFTRAANDIEGRVEISGVASSPQLAFASTPPLPEQEVLPRLLFGRSKQSLSASEAASLASGVATLMSGEEGLLDRARNLTGLDVLDYGETAGGQDAVTAGRYVGDGVFVGARQPLDGKGGSAVVEVEVFDGVKVDAEVGRSEGSSVGATWRFDF